MLSVCGDCVQIGMRRPYGWLATPLNYTAPDSDFFSADFTSDIQQISPSTTSGNIAHVYVIVAASM